MSSRFAKYATVLGLLITVRASAAEPVVLDLWAGQPAGPQSMTTGPEADTQKPTDKLIGGKTVMKVGNVSKPQIEVRLPPADKANGAAVVICPGGGFNILAWDLEGTEIAQWLNENGIAGIILKYRVPTGKLQGDAKWQGPVMDAQRAVSLTRARAEEWHIDPKRVGICGFSAGGATAAITAAKNGERLYEAKDDADQQSCAPTFALLIYPAYLIDDSGALRSEYQITPKTPPMFFAHAADDRVPCEGSAALFVALKKAKIPAELHIFPTGGHGYGLRPTTQPVTGWPPLAMRWMKDRGYLGAAAHEGHEAH